MQIIRDIDEIEYDKKSAITVGTFDGVHLGHRKIIEKLTSVKNSTGLRSILVTFEPHPQIVLRNRAKDIRILTTLEEKLDILKGFDIDMVFVINFTREFAETTAEDFYKNYLINKIGLNDLILGYDHMFGKNREGNFNTLESLSVEHSFTVDKVEEFKICGEHLSSTEIRHLLENGKIEKANELLGSEYSFEAEVIEGRKLGKVLGYPTANLELSNDYKLIPKTGIYAVKVQTGGEEYGGMMSIGTNPTVTDDKSVKCEVHIFDFAKDIYGCKVKVRFVEYLRDEKKFDTLEDLMAEMKRDEERCRALTNRET